MVLFSRLLAGLLLLAAPAALAQTTLPRPTEAEHAQSVTAFQQELNADYRNPAESPLSEKQRATFSGLPFFPTNYTVCVVARFEADSLGAPFPMQTSTARRPLYRKYGVVHFTLEDKPQQLTVYQSMDLQRDPKYRDYLFVPFTDRTNGHGSYGGGRYIDLRRGQIVAGQLILDFNRTYNPYCAYSPRYSCPVPPTENRLPVPIAAGVMSDH
ncbi:DUF1684 domain-containing protein [Hymenobacter sediminicola]|uniref:DUF1684 domain-containing protein n=1 Tax=Hymenobacter sediminicola TaxID=2761579 RepID=A0A7G7W6L3_9BACT|nr:DUF1684 domain-containing protein [Hymenobacter sediminicola]QNH62006.1 DUF1684 domain-containing protein [Hymenobacter sediminicola]